MTDPAVTAALISAVAVETTAIISGVFLLLRNKRNHKNNPGSLHDVLMFLAKMDGKLNRLKDIENKLDDLVGRKSPE